MHQLQRSWVRSQHPSAQWNLRGGRWCSVEYSTKKLKNPPQKILRKKINNDCLGWNSWSTTRGRYSTRSAFTWWREPHFRPPSGKPEMQKPVLWIRIRSIRMLLGLPNSNSDPSILQQRTPKLKEKPALKNEQTALQNMKINNFSIFMCHICPPGSRSAFWMRMWIRIRIQRHQLMGISIRIRNPDSNTNFILNFKICFGQLIYGTLREIINLMWLFLWWSAVLNNRVGTGMNRSMVEWLIAFDMMSIFMH